MKTQITNTPKTRKSIKPLIGSIATLLALSVLPSTVKAGQIWDGGNATANWGDNINWDSNSAPNFAVGLQFAGVTQLTATNNAATATTAGITFNAGAGAFTINGSAVTGTGGITNNSTNTQVIAFGGTGYTLGAAQTFNANTGTLQFSNTTVNLNGLALTLNVNALPPAAMQFDSGTAITGVGAGSSITKTGAGNVNFLVANSYDGTTTINAGGLFAANNAALGTTTGGTIVNSGGTLALSPGVSIGAEALTLNGAGSAANLGALAIQPGAPGAATYGGAITVATNSTITANGSTLTLTGGIAKNGTTLTLGTATSGGGTINVNSSITGAAANSDLVIESLTTNLNAANSYNGPTTIRSSGGAGTGILNANVAGALPTAPRSAVTMDDVGLGGSQLNLNGGFNQVVASLTGAASSVINLNTSILTVGNSLGGPATNFAGVINGLAGAGNVSLVKDGSSTQILSGANTYLGLTNVNAGTLQLGNALALGSTGLGTVVASGATLDLGGQNVGVEAISISGIGTAVGIGALSNSSGTTASLAGILTVVAAADVGGAGNISLDGKVTGGVLTKNGAGTVFLTSNANDYFNTTITAGILQVGGSTVGGGSTGVLGGGVVVNNATLNFNRNDTLVVGNAISGTGAVNQNGTGITSLNGGNSYNGATTVNAGTLRLGNATALGSTAAGTTVVAGATLDLNAQAVGAEAVSIAGNGDAANLQVAALTNNGVATATLAGQLTLTAAATVGSNAGDISLDGGIAGAFGLTKVGTDTVFITNDTNGSTTTTITGGNLQVGGSTAGGTAAGALGSGTVTNNSILTFNRSNAIAVANVIGGTGVLNQNGSSAASVTTLNGANTYTGQTNVNAGTLQLGNATALGSALSGTVVASGATLDLNGQTVGGEAIAIAGTGVGGNGALINNAGASTLAGSLNLTAAATVGGTGNISLDGAVTGAALTKIGTNTVFLTNNGNSYTTTTITTGTLQVGNGGTSGVLGGGAVTNNATLNFNRSDTFTVANTIGGTGVVNQNGTGTTNLSGPNTYTGLTTVNAGVLEVQNNTALGTAAAGTTVVGGAALRLANGIVLGAEALTLNGAGTGAVNALGALTVTAGGTASVGGPITIASNSTINANGGTLNLNGVINKTSVVLTLTGGGTVNVNAAIQITGAPAGFNDDLVVNGTTSNLNAANSYLGPTFIRSVVAGDGTLNANVANALPTVNGRTSITMDDVGAGGSTLNIGGSAGFPLGANQAIASLAGASTSKVLLGANTLTIGFGTAPDTNGTAGASFAGVISGTGGILKNDVSTQIFAGNNTYTGPTNVQGGILQAGFQNTAFGVNSAVTVAGAANALELADFSETIGSLAGSANVKNTIANGPGGAVLTISGTAGITATYSGVISDTAGTPLAIVLNDGSVGGTTVESFSGQSTYQGGTTLNAGRLDIDASSVAVGAIPSVNPVASGPVGTGTLTINGGTIGTSLAIGSNNAIGNNVQVNGSFAVAGNNGNVDGVTFAGNTNLAGATTITTNSGFLDFSGTITGGGGLTLAGSTFTYIGSSSIGGVPGILGQVDASNTYGGTTTVQAGGFVLLGKNSGAIAIPGNLVVDAGATVQVDSFAPNTVGLGTTANQIATTSNVTVNGTLDLSGINQTINGLTGAGQVRLDDVNGGNLGTAAIFTVGSGNFGGSIVDSNKGGQLTKNTAGTLVLTGASTYTGNTNINLGSLVVDGSLKSANILVNPLGTLVGFGKTSGNVTNSGTFRPGANTTQPGTFTIGGNYTQTASGNLVIEIAGKGASDHDLVKVAGKANLNGNLRIVNVNGTRLKVGDKITFISAAGGVSGEFANVNNDFAITDRILTADVHYHTTSVSLELQQGSFGDFAKFKGSTPNQRSVARALDKVAFNPEEGKLIGFLNNEPLGNLLHDFDLIAAEELQAIYTIGFAQANVQTSNLSRRLDDIRSGSAGFSASGYSATGMEPQYSSNYLAPNGGLAGPGGKMSKEMRPPMDNRVGVFFTGSGEFTDVGKTNNASGYNLATAGFTLGMDYRVNENFAIGVNLGYSRTNADLFGNGKVNVDGMKLGLYATYFRDGFYVDALAQGGYNTYDTRRSALQGSATGSTDGTEFNAHLAVGYDWHRGGLTVGPMASVQYTRVGFDSFREDGSLAPLTYGSQSGDSLRTALGAKASYEFQAGSVIIKPEVRAAWQHEFAETSLAIDSRFSNGGGNTFNVQGAEIGADSLLLGAGVAVLWNERTSTYVYYDGEIGRSNYESNNVSGGVRVEF